MKLNSKKTVSFTGQSGCNFTSKDVFDLCSLNLSNVGMWDVSVLSCLLWNMLGMTVQAISCLKDC